MRNPFLQPPRHPRLGVEHSIGPTRKVVFPRSQACRRNLATLGLSHPPRQRSLSLLRTLLLKPAGKDMVTRAGMEMLLRQRGMVMALRKQKDVRVPVVDSEARGDSVVVGVAREVHIEVETVVSGEVEAEIVGASVVDGAAVNGAEMMVSGGAMVNVVLEVMESEVMAIVKEKVDVAGASVVEGAAKAVVEGVRVVVAGKAVDEVVKVVAEVAESVEVVETGVTTMKHPLPQLSTKSPPKRFSFHTLTW